MSNCEGPPTMKRTMLCLALAGKFGNFGTPESAGPSARSCSWASTPARPSRPRPPESDAIQSRRESEFGPRLDIMARKLPRWTPAGPGRIEPACRWSDRSMPCPVPGSWGHGLPHAVHGPNLCRHVRCVVHPIHQMACALLHERTVHDKQLLQRRRGQFAPWSCHHRVGEIVKCQQRIQASTADAAIHGAA